MIDAARCKRCRQQGGCLWGHVLGWAGEQVNALDALPRNRKGARDAQRGARMPRARPCEFASHGFKRLHQRLRLMLCTITFKPVSGTCWIRSFLLKHLVARTHIIAGSSYIRSNQAQRPYIRPKPEPIVPSHSNTQHITRLCQASRSKWRTTSAGRSSKPPTPLKLRRYGKPSAG